MKKLKNRLIHVNRSPRTPHGLQYIQTVGCVIVTTLTLGLLSSLPFVGPIVAALSGYPLVSVSGGGAVVTAGYAAKYYNKLREISVERITAHNKWTDAMAESSSRIYSCCTELDDAIETAARK